MADHRQPPPPYPSIYYGNEHTPEPPQCSCDNNPPLTRQQCPRCINRPNANVHWLPAPTGSIGFRLPAPPADSSRPTCYNDSMCSPDRVPDYIGPELMVVVTNHFGPPKGGVRPYYWVDTFAHGGVPSTALRGGHDIDGAPIYVGRAFHEGDWIPAKVIPDKHVAYVAYGGAEHAKGQYQVLCEQRFDWVPSSGGHVPSGAVEGGKTSDGEALYVGRVHHDGACTVGKVHPSHEVCYVPFDGREIGHDSYEVLVLRN